MDAVALEQMTKSLGGFLQEIPMDRSAYCVCVKCNRFVDDDSIDTTNCAHHYHECFWFNKTLRILDEGCIDCAVIETIKRLKVMGLCS